MYAIRDTTVTARDWSRSPRQRHARGSRLPDVGHEPTGKDSSTSAADSYLGVAQCEPICLAVLAALSLAKADPSKRCRRHWRGVIVVGTRGLPEGGGPSGD